MHFFSLLYFMRLYTSFNSLSQNVELAALNLWELLVGFPGFILILRFVSSLWLSLPSSFLTLPIFCVSYKKQKPRFSKLGLKQKEYKNSLYLIRLSVTVAKLLTYSWAMNLQRKKIRKHSDCLNVPRTLEWVPWNQLNQVDSLQIVI